ncbi:sensor histidine kinase [Vibrio europaeus]|uniref:sensor histidine kinase n=1 Tax=Vibrio europaeus TaxID=300876 RepID=UPI0039E1D57C
MSWLNDPFRRFLNLYAMLVVAAIVLLIVMRTSIYAWFIDNSVLPIVASEANYVYELWEELGPDETKKVLRADHDAIFSYVFKEHITDQELKKLDAYESMGEMEFGIEFYVQENEESDYVSVETYLPEGDGWRTLEVRVEDAFFTQQNQLINGIIYAVGALMIVGFVIAYFMINSIKTRLTDINAASNSITKDNDLHLRIPNENLEGPLSETISELNMMLDRLAQSTEMTKQQANNIAHDLRTPLTSIYHRIQQLSESHSELEEVEQMVANLLNTFNQLLRISRLEFNGEQITQSAVNLQQLVECAAELYEPVLEDNQLNLELNIDPKHQIKASQELMMQVVSNLIDNACKFNQAGKTIRISSAEKADNVELTVADQSGGVGEEELTHLCQKFYRSDSSRNTEGNGLGLSLVAAATKRMGGTLELKDEYLYDKVGLSVTLKFPKVRV